MKFVPKLDPARRLYSVIARNLPNYAAASPALQRAPYAVLRIQILHCLRKDTEELEELIEGHSSGISETLRPLLTSEGHTAFCVQRTVPICAGASPIGESSHVALPGNNQRVCGEIQGY
jgi:hypothetical protein